MALHDKTFGGPVAPNEAQIAQMGVMGQAAKIYADTIERTLLDGPDKTYALRKLREVAMWANVTIMRNPDGSPRT